MSDNLKLAALITLISAMMCATYLGGKWIDYKIAADQQKTVRLVSFDNRCSASGTCKPLSSSGGDVK